MTMSLYETVIDGKPYRTPACPNCHNVLYVKYISHVYECPTPINLLIEANQKHKILVICWKCIDCNDIFTTFESLFFQKIKKVD
jgi:hypothetical protein